MSLRVKYCCFFLMALLFICCTGLKAQNNLMKEVTIVQMNQQRIGRILDKISNNGNFHFAYNNQTIPADSIVSVSGYRGTIYNLLNTLLGADYEFKEVPGYIVLRHAPGRLSLTAEVEEDQSKQFIIKGYVTDAYNHQQVKQVSIYEKNQLISTLTNEQGYFELKLSGYKGALALVASKENYRDTALYVLHNVSVNPTSSKRAYKYYPEDEHQGKTESRFSRFFSSSRQRIQNLNLGGFFAESPYQFSLTPGLSTHGMYNSQVINHFSYNLLGGYTAGIQGVEVAGLFNIDRKDVDGLQVAGLFNVVGGSVSGVQIAGLSNKSGDINDGFQLAGIMNIAGKVKGVQLAGLVNIADSSDYPIGLVNIVKNGEKSLSLSTDEFFFTHVNFRSGGRVLYGIVGLGYKLNGDPIRYALELGFGAHLIRGNHFNLDGEYLNQASIDFRGNSSRNNSFRLLPGYRLTKQLKFFAGPSFNIYSGTVKDGLKIPGWQLHQSASGNNITNMHIGLNTGLQWIW
jgi:hypothetical protein